MKHRAGTCLSFSQTPDPPGENSTDQWCQAEQMMGGGNASLKKYPGARTPTTTVCEQMAARLWLAATPENNANRLTGLLSKALVFEMRMRGNTKILHTHRHTQTRTHIDTHKRTHARSGTLLCARQQSKAIKLKSKATKSNTNLEHGVLHKVSRGWQPVGAPFFGRSRHRARRHCNSSTNRHRSSGCLACQERAGRGGGGLASTEQQVRTIGVLCRARDFLRPASSAKFGGLLAERQHIILELTSW